MTRKQSEFELNDPTTVPEPKQANYEKVAEQSAAGYVSLKALYLRRRVAVIMAVVFSLSGIILGVLSTEIAVIRFLNKKRPKITDHKDGISVYYVRWAISGTTLLLIVCIIWDFILRRKIQVIEKNLNLFFHAVSVRHVGLLMIEIAVCAIHPMPLDYRTMWPPPSQRALNGVREAPIEVIFNMLMFLRIYLIARVMILFSRFRRDSSANSIAKINHVQLDYVFVFKSFMHLYPTRVLIGCATITFLWAAWAIRVCEMNNATGLRDGYLKNLWFIGVTFLTIGYGDVIPDTICGKTIAIGTGVVGVVFTAMVIAVLSRKMEMSRPERRIQEFLLEGELNTRIQNCAAEVIRLAWKQYNGKTRGAIERLNLNQKLIQATRKFRKLRTRKGHLVEKSLSFVDISHENERLERLLLDTLRQVKYTREEMRQFVTKTSQKHQ